jgi:LysM repeat protein
MKRLLLIGFVLLTTTLMAQMPNPKVQQYIAAYKDLAMAEMQRTGIPASIKLAQGILESQAGESPLSKRSNNHFGIKCKTEWTGARTYHDDDARGECFRVYNSVEESYKDHSEFLKTRPHYSFLFLLDPADYKAWANGLKKAGYATSKTYPQQLIKTIEENNLQQFSELVIAKNNGKQDLAKTVEPAIVNNQPPVTQSGPNQVVTIQEEPKQTGKTTVVVEDVNDDTDALAETVVSGIIAKPKNTAQKAKPYPDGIFSINGSKVFYANAGTSLLAIADQYDLSMSKLLEYNDLDGVDVLEKDQLIFIEKKARKSEKDFHIVEGDETWYEISQKEGIALKSLLELNNLKKEVPLAKGEKIHLKPKTSVVAKTPANRL